MDRIDKIIKRVAGKGDSALLKYTLKYDGVRLAAGDIEVKNSEIDELASEASENIRSILSEAAENIRKYSEPQSSEKTYEKDGIQITDRFIPVNRAGIYVPGGEYPYPSTVLMCAVPARAAGVEEIIMATPPSNLTPAVAAAIRIAGVDRVFRVGGAQAIAAMALGTESVPKADMIAGPGNKFVQQAKLKLSGEVGIDMLAGPSEVVIIASENQNARWIASDLISQAEHGEGTKSILISLSEQLTGEVKKLIPEKFSGRISCINVSTIEEAVKISNDTAPEHLQIMLEEKIAGKAASMVKNAGAVFMGPYSPACLGDYWAGPSHVLPTGKAARYSEGLSWRSFVKKVSFIKSSREGMKQAAEKIAALADEEGMKYHSRSARSRTEE